MRDHQPLSLTLLNADTFVILIRELRAPDATRAIVYFIIRELERFSSFLLA